MEENEFAPRINLTELQQSAEKIRNELGKIIVGQKQVVDQLMAALFANGHVLIEGVPGIAKTLTAKLLARAVGTGFSRIQFTPDLMPSDILGTSVFNQKITDFEFRRGPIFSNLILIDEINRAPAKTQSALFEVMEERQISMDGKRYQLEAPFIVFATQNPIEHEGTYRLPEAQLDRFMLKVEVDYPALADEIKILEGHHSRKMKAPELLIEQVLPVSELLRAQQLVSEIMVEEKLIGYIASIIGQTRNFSGIYLGASPRAGIALMNASKALAGMQGRDFVTPDDIQFMAYPVLRHRIMLTPDKEMEGAKANDLIKQILEKIEVPR